MKMGRGSARKRGQSQGGWEILGHKNNQNALYACIKQSENKVNKITKKIEKMDP